MFLLGNTIMVALLFLLVTSVKKVNSLFSLMVLFELLWLLLIFKIILTSADSGNLYDVLPAFVVLVLSTSELAVVSIILLHLKDFLCFFFTKLSCYLLL